MLGAIIGDIVGSPYEFDQGDKTTDFPLFIYESQYIDDSVMTLAVGDALMAIDGDETIADQTITDTMRRFAKVHRLPKGGYGRSFTKWLLSKEPEPYGSWGNGAAMRVSAAGWLYPSLAETERWAAITARVTHNHPEGIKGAQATAAAIFLARTEGASQKAKRRVRNYITETYGYDLTRTCDDIRPNYRHVESCMETVPEAITAYLESDGFEHAIRLAVSLGGDTDTLAAITGSIAHAAYGVPDGIAAQAHRRLSPDLQEVLSRFNLRMAA